MPRGFTIGNFEIYYYALILMAGAFLAAVLAEREARRRGLRSELVWDGLIWVLIGGVVGARLWHVFTPPPSMQAQGITTQFYLTHPLDLINTRLGGLGIPGAILGGGIALFLFTRQCKLSFGLWADIAAPALALGQAVGRWGNFINQEVYGAPTNLPWAITIDPANRLPGYANFSRYHPLFLYESLWNLANMFFLLWAGRKLAHRLKDGDLFLIYLIIYPFGRFFLEFLRLDAAQVAGINANQTVSLVVMILSAVILFLRHRLSRDTTSEAEEPAAS